MLRYLTAGESHGMALLAILEGLPSGLRVKKEQIDLELSRRQSGYGRGPRMKIEKDKVEILCGLHKGLTIGSPLGLLINNKDYSIDRQDVVTNPRPGHADLAGVLKYGFNDVRSVLERASARETAARVSIGAVCKVLLAEFKIRVKSEPLSVGGRTTKEEIQEIIDEAVSKKDTLGGAYQLTVTGVPAGLGSYVHADKRLNARLACSLMSIPGTKAIELGLGFAAAEKFGSEVHDAIFYTRGKGYYRETNNAGGIEGGMSNGEPIVMRCYMKPITTLGKPLDSVNIWTKRKTLAAVQRADICVIEAAGVIGEGMAAFEIANCLLEKFGGDSLKDIKANFSAYLKRINR